MDAATTWRDARTEPGGLGLHVVTLETKKVPTGGRVHFKIIREQEDGGAEEFTLAARALG